GDGRRAVVESQGSVAVGHIVVLQAETGTDAPGSSRPHPPFSDGSQRIQQRLHRRVDGLLPARYQVPQLVVAQLQQLVERNDLLVTDPFASQIEKPRQDQVILQHSAPATPAQAIELGARYHRSGAGPRTDHRTIWGRCAKNHTARFTM